MLLNEWKHDSIPVCPYVGRDVVSLLFLEFLLQENQKYISHTIYWYWYCDDNNIF